MTGAPRRPGPVTGAAAVLMVAGALSLVAGLLRANGVRGNIDLPFLEGELERIAALGLVVRAPPALLAGWRFGFDRRVAYSGSCSLRWRSSSA